ncbi:hypothetical protein F0Q45_21785 [Mycobacterium simiae]|uniref:Uncharacterized protein n=1 Tax=Mycobacterium simiae TaxID=1784 RepID=A0A5B1BMM6_MYCSI|nr:hypothetical protein [Mycobacterium simiae]KAA1248229.1 hypothetical protein F0Q45_21785 [Mycobacterium simiae]
MPLWVNDTGRGGGSAQESDAQHVPGIYAALREKARADWDSPEGWDPRWKRQQHAVTLGGGWQENAVYCGQPGVVCEHDPAPAEYRDRFARVWLAQFESGQPVGVTAKGMPAGMLPLSGRSDVVYRVGPDDIVTPRS